MGWGDHPCADMYRCDYVWYMNGHVSHHDEFLMLSIVVVLWQLGMHWHYGCWWVVAWFVHKVFCIALLIDIL